MADIKRKKYVFYSKWDKLNLKCACLFHDPLCDKYKTCEEVELLYSPYEDIEEAMTKQRVYKRVKGSMRQIR